MGLKSISEMFFIKGRIILSFLLPLASSSWDKSEKDAILRVVESDMFTMGNETNKFEDAFSKWAGVEHSIMVNSGSSANLIAVAAIRYSGFGKQVEKPEVIVPSVSWITTYSPLFQLGYKVKLIDIDMETLNIDISRIEEAINKNTVGIFAVNLLGNPADWSNLKKIAVKNDLWLLEDNCESMGAKLGGQLTGSFGLMGTFSFFYSHHISTMEGGMITCNDSVIAQHLRSLRAHGWSRGIANGSEFLGFTRGTPWEENFRFYLPGFNVRPTEIAAAIGSCQLSKFPEMLKTRRRNAQYLQTLLQDSDSPWKLQVENGNSSWFTFGFVNKSPEASRDVRKRLISKLEQAGISTRPIVAGNILRHPVAQVMQLDNRDALPNSDRLHKFGFMIGNHAYSIERELDIFVTLISENE